MRLLNEIRIVLLQYLEFRSLLAEARRLPARDLARLGLGHRAGGDVARWAFAEAERRVAPVLHPHAAPTAAMSGNSAPAPV